MMSLRAEQRVLQLDAKISDLKTELEEAKSVENPDIAQRLRTVNLQKEIQQLRLILNYTLHDIRRPFHYYRLPAEMHAEIFKWVTSPQDQLTLLKMFPEVGPLMQWDEGTLHFSLVYPLVYPYICKNWQDSLTLCKVSAQFQQIVLDHHKTLMSGGLYLYPSPWNADDCLMKVYEFDRDQHTLTNEINAIENEDYSGYPWMNIDATPFLFCIRFDGETRQSFNDPLLQTFLARHGKKIMACEISFFQTENEFLYDDDWFFLFNGVLSGTPNLHCLSVWVDSWEMQNFGLIANVGNREVQDYPDLPNLKFFWTWYAPSSLTQQYGPGLKELRITGDVPIMNGNCSQLEVCVMEILDNIPASFSNSLSNSPLKVLTLRLDGTRNQISMPCLLQLISKYGSTLEKLSIDYLPHMLIADDWSNLETEWIILVKLPNLKVLKLEKYFGRLDFMLALPSLTKLYLIRCRPAENPEGQGDGIHVQPHLLEFPWTNDNRKYETKIWNYLANLKYLHVKMNALVIFSITRWEHEEYHRTRESRQGAFQN